MGGAGGTIRASLTNKTCDFRWSRRFLPMLTLPIGLPSDVHPPPAASRPLLSARPPSGFCRRSRCRSRCQGRYPLLTPCLRRKPRVAVATSPPPAEAVRAPPSPLHALAGCSTSPPRCVPPPPPSPPPPHVSSWFSLTLPPCACITRQERPVTVGGSSDRRRAAGAGRGGGGCATWSGTML